MSKEFKRNADIMDSDCKGVMESRSDAKLYLQKGISHRCEIILIGWNLEPNSMKSLRNSTSANPAHNL